MAAGRACCCPGDEEDKRRVKDGQLLTPAQLEKQFPSVLVKTKLREYLACPLGLKNEVLGHRSSFYPHSGSIPGNSGPKNSYFLVAQRQLFRIFKNFLNKNIGLVESVILAIDSYRVQPKADTLEIKEGIYALLTP